MFLFIGAFYFILDNIRPEYRSSINLINLFALCKVEYMKAYGMDRILQPFMKDIQSLESVSFLILMQTFISYALSHT